MLVAQLVAFGMQWGALCLLGCVWVALLNSEVPPGNSRVGEGRSDPGGAVMGEWEHESPDGADCWCSSPAEVEGL